MDNKIKFSAVGTMISFYPGDQIPLFPDNINTQPGLEEFILSPLHRGIPPLFHTFKSVECELNQIKEVIDNLSLMNIQIQNSPIELVFRLISKVDADLDQITTPYFKANPEHHNLPWEDSLNWYQRDTYYNEGLSFLSQLKNFNQDLFTNIVTQSVTNPTYGLKAHLETEISDNFGYANKKYENWDEDIVILFDGKFSLDITVKDDEISDISFFEPPEILSIFVRNYDES